MFEGKNDNLLFFILLTLPSFMTVLLKVQPWFPDRIRMEHPSRVPEPSPPSPSPPSASASTPSPESRGKRRSRSLLSLVKAKKRIRRPSFVDRLYPQRSRRPFSRQHFEVCLVVHGSEVGSGLGVFRSCAASLAFWVFRTTESDFPVTGPPFSKAHVVQTKGKFFGSKSVASKPSNSSNFPWFGDPISARISKSP